MDEIARILVVDDEVNIRGALVRLLQKAGHQAEGAASGTEALARFQAEPFDLVLTDVRMKGMDGLDLLRAVKDLRPETEVLVMTAYAAVESAVEAMRRGAYDYLVKPLDLSRLPLLVARVLERQRVAAENRRLRERLEVRDRYEYVIGKSGVMRRIYETVDQVADTQATVLLQGESGTGKELIARAIHQRSSRRDQPFVAINCGALPESLLESELFGYDKGAFTGATAAKKGRIELADGGTLFLDEVSEMSARTQVDLLRVLQEKEFRRLGGTGLIRVDLRVIAASNQDLQQRVKDGAFREDLYYRLNVVPIRLPPLRERQEDIPILLNTFLREFAAQYQREPLEVSEAAEALLLRYEWPGNVRELRNVAERLVVTVRDAVLRPPHLPENVQESRGALRHILIPLGRPLEEVEREVIRRTLQDVTSHREEAARILGISPRTLYNRLKELELEGRQHARAEAPEGGHETSPQAAGGE